MPLYYVSNVTLDDITKTVSRLDFTLMYCLVMLSAFLNTVFRKTEKITKQFKIVPLFSRTLVS